MNPFDTILGSETGFDEPLGRFEIKLLIVTGCILVAIAPVVQTVQSFWVDILVRALIFALFALSLDVAFGYAGLLSLGHGAMFGAGGYVASLLLLHVTPNLILVLALAVLSGVVIAAIIGAVSVRSTGIYFAMLTLALAQILYIVVFNDVLATFTDLESLTGGDNGLFGMADYQFLGVGFDDTIVFYYLVLALLFLAVVFVLRLTNSPFGRAVQAIRENEERARFIGYNPERYKLIMFSISGGLAGLAGALYAPFLGAATPSLLHWSTSGEVVLMVLIGGMGTLWGPMLGGGFFLILEEMLSTIDGWEMILGAVMIAVVMFSTGGLAGFVSLLLRDPRDSLSGFYDRVRTLIERD